MLENKSDIAFINHDIKNYIGNSISILRMIKLENPDLVGGECVEIVIDGLYRAIELSNDIAYNIESTTENKKPASNSGMMTVNLNRHLDEKTKPIYEQLRKRTGLTINDTYEILEEDKFIFINHALIMSFRENIISNALKAGATRLDIHHEMKKHYGIATYKDNGKGMTQNELDKIILSLHGDGVICGLGTQSIFKVAEEIGFHVSYTSVEGEGTTIRIIYPYVKL